MVANSERTGQVAEALEIVHAHVMAQFFPRIAGEMHVRDLSFSQFVTLLQIFMRGPQTISELAQGASMTHTAASRMVDRLVRLGLLSRKENPDDRREKIVELTKLGRAFPPTLRRTSTAAYGSLLERVSPELVTELGRVLDKIIPQLPPVPDPFYED